LRRSPAWIRYGLAGGVLTFALTLGANLLVLAVSLNQLCRVGPALFLLSSLVGFFAFLLVATATGFATSRAGGVIMDAALSGLLLGGLGGCAVLASLAAAPAVHQRLVQAGEHCPVPNPFNGGVYSFQVGMTPPPGLIPSPPPGSVTSSPQPAFSAGFSGGSAAISVSGALARALEIASTAITIIAGMALAAGAAALGGGIGISLRSR
jgi:hypothetical protein